jgi:hypothetical protein
MNGERIHELSVELSKDTPGPHGHLSKYHKARRQLERQLTDEQRQRYKAMAKEWSEKRLPPMMQRRYVHGNDCSRFS